jgi:hypothetical protein
MAKHVILEAYSFNRDTKTVVITGKNIRKEQLLLITNVTAGTVIYNFSDPSLQGTVTNAVDATTGQETATIVVNYVTSSMNNTDKLAILVEETYQEIIPSEVMRDPVDKMRVSTPQSLIDTDFEYGIQTTKWETLNLLNNRPSAFYDSTQPITSTAGPVIFNGSNTSNYSITNVTASGRIVTVAIGNTTGLTAGTPIFITGTLDTANVDGWWVVEVVSANVSIQFTVLTTPATALYDATKTYLYPGFFYSGAGIPLTSIVTNGSVGTVTCQFTHGLRVGDSFYINGTTGTSGSGTAAGTINSSWVVATTPTNSTFTFATTAGAVTATLSAGATLTLFPRALGYVEHRPFDGGIQFSNESPVHGYQVIRQTRRQFRYQSGKGIQFSTGSILKPTFAVDNVTSSGSTVTVTTRYPHGVLPGAFIRITGCNETAYNGTFAVVTAANPTTLTYTAGSTPSATPATGANIVVGPWTWYGSSNRLGMFDSQNGFYFEYDGQTLFVVKRSSTTQLSGKIAVNNGAQSVVGTGTKFSQQLKSGDFVVIRGMSYQVSAITSDTQMYIYPEYRGTNLTNAVVSKTINTRFPQSSWNIDKLDGTGASLMTLDLTKMQMFYADYTWYGAGAIRFGFKNNRGEVVYCHRIPNNNVNSEAYMRSGNLVSRYETNTIPYQSFLTATLSSAATTGATISVADTTGWPPSGTVVLYTPAATAGAIEYISYSAKTLTSLTITARAQTGGSSAQTFTVTGATAGNPGGTAPILAEVYSPQNASSISHWGSSVIMDGRYDDDKSFLFNYGQNTQASYATAGTRFPVFSIRLAPSVDNGNTGLLGAREIVNRMQLTPAGIGVFASTSTVRVELVLNGRVSSSANAFVPVGGSSLAQRADHGGSATIVGGESIFTFFAPAGSVSSQDLTKIRDIGNSILGGGNALTVPNTPANIFPDGPDIITICVTPLASNAFVAARMAWTEAQA